MDENIILSTKGLDLWYGTTQALKNVSIDIPEKKVTALIGPSGCGKSTFLRTIDRMNDLVQGVKITGSIQYRGVEIYDPSMDVTWLRKQIGMVFQKPNPFPMSIYDNIASTSPTAPGPTASRARPSWMRSWKDPSGGPPSGTR